MNFTQHFSDIILFFNILCCYKIYKGYAKILTFPVFSCIIIVSAHIIFQKKKIFFIKLFVLEIFVLYLHSQSGKNFLIINNKYLQL
jgi:hypothetical protein